MTRENGIIVALSSLFERFAKGIKNKHYIRVVVPPLHILPLQAIVLSEPTPMY
jgi:hypothetical protein